MTTEQRRPSEAVEIALALADGPVSLATLVAAVLEESEHLTIAKVYSGIWHEVRSGRAEVREENTASAITYVMRREPKPDEDLTDWTLANDSPLARVVERLEEVLDEALAGAGAGNLAVRVMASVHEAFVRDLSVALAAERGRAVGGYVRESGVHPHDVVRRTGGPRSRGPRSPRVTNPAPSRRFAQ